MQTLLLQFLLLYRLLSFQAHLLALRHLLPYQELYTRDKAESVIIWGMLRQRFLVDNNNIVCDSYGNIQLLNGHLLPVVCHRKDASQFEVQKSRSLSAAASGAILVSARIAKGEQNIIDSAISQGFPVVTVEDNGFPSLYHPSEARMDLCSANKLLIVSPWKYVYRHVADAVGNVDPFAVWAPMGHRSAHCPQRRIVPSLAPRSGKAAYAAHNDPFSSSGIL